MTLCLTVLLANLCCCSAFVFSNESIEFSRDIKPILSDKCFACHGPDSDAREADLRLDVREDALADRGGYQAVLPGKPEDSELIARIDTDDDDMRMPPPDFGKPLSEQERKLLSGWIAQGRGGKLTGRCGRSRVPASRL